ncbi:hypothetical protein CROQUDRAFT_225803 [Cronartium quercuum f. sp. fusiforme G11]|uniref:Uncharacterized protein n=1 Tax=Cronartium quercuum f. sp. fusiforme G11 TaxID=708437 RepID=A0A9P6NE21_9BASI|nr:hypothetical protein CROQUDRAFT_225803 [Cronartium quercuum f. sp. fusiforme G11]
MRLNSIWEFSLNELIEFIRLKWSKVQSRVCGLRSCVGWGCCAWVWVARGSLVGELLGSQKK